MAAFDLVTWSPRVGSTGDDKYNLPGATNLAGAVSSGGPSRITAGSSSFSAIPTLSEINAAEGMNQVIALFNRRTQQFISAFGTSAVNTTPTAQSYLGVNTRVGSSFLSSFQSNVNFLRNAEGFASYSFPSIPAGGRITGEVLAHFRKALAISGQLTLNFRYTVANGEYGVWTKNVNSPFTEAITNGSATVSSNYIGRFAGATGALRRRMLVNFRVPTWFTSASDVVTASLRIRPTSVTGSPTLEAFISNTNDKPVDVTDVTHTDNSLGTLTPVVGNNSFPISDPSLISDQAGGYVSVIVQCQQEVAGTTSTIRAIIDDHNVSGNQPAIFVTF